MSCRALVLLAFPLVTLTAVAAVGAELELGLAAGADLTGTVTVDFGRETEDLELDPGFNLGLEVLAALSSVDIGVGAEVGFARGSTYGDVSTTALYAVGRWHVAPRFYLVGCAGGVRLTYSEMSSEWDDEGALWSAGIGVEIVEHLRVEARYSATVGDLDLGLETASVRLVVVL